MVQYKHCTNQNGNTVRNIISMCVLRNTRIHAMVHGQRRAKIKCLI